MPFLEMIPGRGKTYVKVSDVCWPILLLFLLTEAIVLSHNKASLQFVKKILLSEEEIVLMEFFALSMKEFVPFN